jgi:hypothetical protein
MNNFTARSCVCVRPTVIVSFLAVCTAHGKMTARPRRFIYQELAVTCSIAAYTQKAQTNARALIHLVKLVNLMTLFVIVSRLGDYNAVLFFPPLYVHLLVSQGTDALRKGGNKSIRG